ncbi:hypothetical protein ACTA71_011827 [Dictyostelium dimigraforme]
MIKWHSCITITFHHDYSLIIHHQLAIDIASELLFVRENSTQHSLIKQTQAVKVTYVPPNHSIYIYSGNMQLGNWRTDRAVKLSDENYPIKSVVHWEYGNDRWFTANTTHADEYSSTINEDGDSFFNDGEFEDSQLLRSTVPIFSSRSKQGLVYYTWRDRYPYSSVYALHPIYIHIGSITKDPKILSQVNEHRNKLINYEAVMNLKTKLREIYSKEKKSWGGDFNEGPVYSNITNEEIEKESNPNSKYYGDDGLSISRITHMPFKDCNYLFFEFVSGKLPHLETLPLAGCQSNSTITLNSISKEIRHGKQKEQHLPQHNQKDKRIYSIFDKNYIPTV